MNPIELYEVTACGSAVCRRYEANIASQKPLEKRQSPVILYSTEPRNEDLNALLRIESSPITYFSKQITATNLIHNKDNFSNTRGT